MEVQLSPSFKKQARKAVYSLFLFFFSYLVIVGLALALLAVFVLLAMGLMTRMGSYWAGLLGIGLISLGVLILLFVLKFTLSGKKRDTSEYMELSPEQEPTLFAVIGELSATLGTRPPKRVYLSPGVDASVFFDSNFWSLLFPVGKNLNLGMGLINAVTQEELKAVMAHEFGHFSQKSMKVGTYVYYINQAIFNMLYENGSYDTWAKKWGNLHGFFLLFVSIAMLVIKGIQWLLKKLYATVNRSYLALSREMEFNADEIAASVTGYAPLKSSLLRFSWAESAFSEVQNFYLSHTEVAPINMYADQTAMLLDWVKLKQVDLRFGLPHLRLDQQDLYQTSKLVIKDQWASHPPLEDRIARLEATGFETEAGGGLPAGAWFQDVERLQEEFTQRVIAPQENAELLSAQEFLINYKLAYDFPVLYSGYYDHKSPELDLLDDAPPSRSLSELFSPESTGWVYSKMALQNDLGTLEFISTEPQSVETFDYDGQRYQSEEAGMLSTKLQAELEEVTKLLQENDREIYRYFLAHSGDKAEGYAERYRAFLAFDKEYDSLMLHFTALSSALAFTQEVTPHKTIDANFEAIKPLEENLRKELAPLLEEPLLQNELTEEVRLELKRYIAGRFAYFFVDKYDEEELNLLFSAMHNYSYLLLRKYFLMKKNLLFYQAELLSTGTN